MVNISVNLELKYLLLVNIVMCENERIMHEIKLYLRLINMTNAV